MPEKRKKLCFVLMPFKDELRKVYDKAIKPACDETGLRSLRVDELPGVYNINRKIIENIFKSHIIIADLTEWNPNVFYEMGVAHAIDNKTIMIIQKGQKVPFDVSTYSCLLYKQNETDFKNLKEKLVESINHFEEWRKEPANPVQDYKPPDAFIPISTLKQLEKELKEKDEILKKSVSKNEYSTIEIELHRIKQQMAKMPPQTQFESLQKQLAQKEKENKNLHEELNNIHSESVSYIPTSKMPLRSKPIENLTDATVKKMLADKGFFDKNFNKNGTGINHQYKKQQNGQIIFDETTGLFWQQSGSDQDITFQKAQDIINNLNNEKYAGYGNWRLPTLEEAMCLMEPVKKKNNLYIDPVFDSKQYWIWTSDKLVASSVWVVDFDIGYCVNDRMDDDVYVRAVCRGQ